jgi:RNA polymerase sigma-70 factor (ECF subfamily)
VKARKRSWEEREFELDERSWSAIGAHLRGPFETASTRELTDAVREAMERELTDRERRVIVAVAVDDVPVDVLADRLQTSADSLEETLLGARQKLRAALAERGLDPDEGGEQGI